MNRQRARRPRGEGGLYRRKGTWWTKLYRDGVAQYRSTGTGDRLKAADILAERRLEMGRPTRDVHGEAITLEGVFERILANYKRKHRKTPGRVQQAARRFLEHFDAKTLASSITAGQLETYIAKRQRAGISDTTIHLECVTLKHGLRLADLKFPKVEIPSVPPNAREGFFDDDEVVRLLGHLPDYLQPLVEAGYMTGMRCGMLKGLQWSDVDLRERTIRLPGQRTKAGKPWVIHYGDDLARLLDAQRAMTSTCEREQERLIPFVFHRHGVRIRDFRHAWMKATKAAGLAGKVFHDLRRSAVRNLVRAGVPQSVAMTISGHRTASVFERYNIIDGSDQLAAFEALSRRRMATGD